MPITYDRWMVDRQTVDRVATALNFNGAQKGKDMLTAPGAIVAVLIALIDFAIKRSGRILRHRLT